MKCLNCGHGEMTLKFYQPRKTGYTHQKEKAVFICPVCGHKELFGI